MTLSRPNIDTVVKIVGLLVAIFGIFKYFEDVAGSRALAGRQASLAYVVTYNGVELKNQNHALFEFWIKNADAIVFMQKNGMSDAEYRSFLLTAFEHDDHPKQLLDAVYAISTFYDQVELCRSAQICDNSVIQAYFCRSAGEFSRKYKPVFAQLSAISGMPDFGQGARVLGKSC